MKPQKRTRALVISAILIIVVSGAYLASRQSQPARTPDGGKNSEQQALKDIYPVTSFSHAHGLAVDVSDPKKLYIATHEGLFVLLDEKDLYQIGKSKDDFMGFSPHLSNANVFYSSGHPRSGGNLGVQKSEDSGVTWKKISNGAGGPVDFHAMTISLVNPDIMYGWYGGLQKSTDGGKEWTAIRASLPDVIAFTADLKDEKGIYAATVQGLFGSVDKGQTWKSISPQLENSPVTVFALDPNEPKNALSFSQKMGLARSEDGGITWKSISGIEDVIFHIAFDRSTLRKAYLLTRSHALYKTLDGGITWEKIR